MNTIRLKTPFEVGKVPLSEYPRPQFARDSYKTLNGYWDYSIFRREDGFPGWQGKILVPYSPECLLSGLPEGMEVKPDDVLCYRLKFDMDESFFKGCTLLHFDAVDCFATVYLNEQELGTHVGGYTAFGFDVTGIIKAGTNVLEVIVTDPSDTSYHSRGKQKLSHGGIWYTPQSGIWQSVWLESLPETHLRDMTILPDIDRDKLVIKLDIAGDVESVDIAIMDGNKLITAVKCFDDVAVIDFDDYELWSPENPKLYDLAVKVGDDIVRSYFGMRKFSVITDRDGYRRLALNNKPYFHTGVLDQGYWSDGMLTPPSNAALEYDVKLVKSMGFNMIRKHIKIEPLRWYYHCDKEGVLVWQDMVSGGTDYSFWAIGILPFIGIHVRDDHYKFFSRADEEGRREYLSEMADTVSRLKTAFRLRCGCPSTRAGGSSIPSESRKTAFARPHAHHRQRERLARPGQGHLAAQESACLFPPRPHSARQTVHSALGVRRLFVAHRGAHVQPRQAVRLQEVQDARRLRRRVREALREGSHPRNQEGALRDRVHAGERCRGGNQRAGHL